MANTKITALTELVSGGTADGDMVPLVDVSDTTQGASGTLKKFSWGSLKATLKTYFDGIYGPKGPAFRVYRATSTQSITSSTITKILFNAEDFDTSNCFDTTTSRFTPNVAGYYQLNWCVRTRSATASITDAAVMLYKNATQVALTELIGNFNSTAMSITGSTMIFMNGSTDYLELSTYVTGSSPFIDFDEKNTYFTGNLVRLA